MTLAAALKAADKITTIAAVAIGLGVAAWFIAQPQARGLIFRATGIFGLVAVAIGIPSHVILALLRRRAPHLFEAWNHRANPERLRLSPGVLLFTLYMAFLEFLIKLILSGVVFLVVARIGGALMA